MSATANEFGPVQMLVVGFETDELTGKVLEELKRLREADIVRLVDLLVVARTTTATWRSCRPPTSHRTRRWSSARSSGR